MTMPINNLNKLSLIPTEELLGEVMARYEHAVFCACKNMLSTRGEIAWERKGLYFAQLGLVDYINKRIHEKEPNREEDK